MKWGGNPCYGIWARKSTLRRWTDSWGDHVEGEQYWSVAGDYNAAEDIVRLHPYAGTIKDWNRATRTILLRPEHVRDQFEYLGEGA